ncbi:MAG TPA: cobalt-precorrin-5B (C(1))-methyltransferase, partial [Methanoregula sp.]|nr:cobalt-precorrin-5B (C(1))-methyltransferase [Methanoregula sp.]
MRDPVTGFEYPAEWAGRCREQDKLQLVKGGLAVLTASGTVLLRGFTTGTTAAAAGKAAVLSLKGSTDFVDLKLPCGLVAGVSVTGESGRASCRKFSGDYPGDATSGIEFVAEAVPGGTGMTLIAGNGIGRFGRDTSRFRKGEPAISPPARECIESAIREAMECTGIDGVTVTISAPDGAEVARGTLNQKVGVMGGISVLGTTGFVEPWDDHLTESVMERIAAARNPVLTTGRTGLKYSRLLFPEREAILVGGKIGEALAA